MHPIHPHPGRRTPQVHFCCDVVPSKMGDLLAAGLDTKLKLNAKISTGGCRRGGAGHGVQRP